VLVDTNVLARTLQTEHPRREVARAAIKILIAQGHELCVMPQNLIELWTVATRPPGENGLGMTPREAAELQRIKSMFALLPETSAIYPAWEALVTQYAVSGKPAHDAHLVAAMQTHGLTSILTFDKTGFSRFPGITVVHPADVKAAEREPKEPAGSSASDLAPSD